MPAADALLKLYNESRSFLSVYPDFDLSKLPDWVAGALLGPIMQPHSSLEVVETLGTSLNINAKIPVILWGGVDTDTVEEFKKMPTAGLACLGGIWNYADPVNAFIKLNRAVAG